MRLSRALTALLLLLSCACSRKNNELTSAPSSDDTPSSASPRPTATAPSTNGWNAAQIDWMPYDVGLTAAKSQNKPVCLVISTTWCGHCKNYSHVFEDPRIVEKSQSFVMIHVDSDVNEDIAKRYATDGGYIPRTFFLAPDGTIDETLHAPRDRFRFFYDEANPSSLLSGMTGAIAKLVH